MIYDTAPFHLQQSIQANIKIVALETNLRYI
jgi:hypothetical protein